jgi:hypothetical protein
VIPDVTVGATQSVAPGVDVVGVDVAGVDAVGIDALGVDTADVDAPGGDAADVGAAGAAVSPATTGCGVAESLKIISACARAAVIASPNVGRDLMSRAASASCS